uniref:ubiquitinyl hydrolase 1 n=1 Tax=Phallusia mammillata TaxID=59560 RepID=A0A6F9DXB5_9ASCI|nr:Zn-finger (Ran-binding)-3 [Phallusia mammillata]
MSRQEQKWSCPRCTYDNYLASSKCSICCHPRDSEVIQPPPITTEKPLVIDTSVPQTSTEKDQDEELIIYPQTRSTQLFVSNQASNNEDLLISQLDDNPRTSRSPNELQIVATWPCQVCTFLNTDCSNEWCSQCRTPKGEYPPEDNDPPPNNAKKQKWVCAMCTYENWDASKSCVVCRTEKNHLKTSSGANNVTELSTDAASSETTTMQSHKNVDNWPDQSAKVTEVIHDSEKPVYTPNNAKPESGKSSAGNGTAGTRSGASSNSSSRSHSPRQELDLNAQNQQRSARWRRTNAENQACSSRTVACSSQQRSNSPLSLSRSSSASHLYSLGRLEIVDNRSYKNRNRNLNWLFMKACIGIVDDNVEAVDAYLTHGGNIARTLTSDDIHHLNRPSAFDIGHTLVHLAIRFQRHNILRLLLTPEVAPRAFKRNPAHLSPDIAELIRREIASSIRTKKGDFHCRFLSEFTTFQLPLEICDLPPSIQKLLFNELLDQDVQKELEEEGAINWSPGLLRYGDCNNRLYSLWNRSAGDCLLDSVLQATWGVFDRDNVLRAAMSDSLEDCATSFFRRWREWEHYQADLLGYSLTERQCLHDWAFIHSLAQQPGASLEHCHIFVLCHILRRPIIVYGIKYLKSFRGETLGFAKFQGVYLPFLWDESFCYTSPIALGYTRGHFTALVTMENSMKNICASSRHRFQPFNTVKYLPLVDSDGKILPIHFTTRTEAGSEEQRREILHEWLDCHMTECGSLVAVQRPGKRPSSVTRLVDEWLDHYRHLSFRRLGEEGHSDDED